MYIMIKTAWDFIDSDMDKNHGLKRSKEIFHLILKVLYSLHSVNLVPFLLDSFF